MCFFPREVCYNAIFNDNILTMSYSIDHAHALQAVLHSPHELVALARQTSTGAVDFLQKSEGSSLWAQIISVMIDDVLKGNTGPHSVFAIVRRWSHPSSPFYCVPSSEHNRLYLETVQSVACHPQGQQFIDLVRNKKGPVRQWMEELHDDTKNFPDFVEQMLTANGSGPVFEQLWMWLLQTASISHHDFPFGALAVSGFSTKTLAQTIIKTCPYSVPSKLCEEIWSFPDFFDVLKQVKPHFQKTPTAYREFMFGLSKHFCVRQKGLTPYVLKNPQDICEALDLPRCASELVNLYNNNIPFSTSLTSRQKTLVATGRAVVSLWEETGRKPQSDNDPWLSLSLALEQSGLLSYVVAHSLDIQIEDEEHRWRDLIAQAPSAQIACVLRHPSRACEAELASPSVRQMMFISCWNKSFYWCQQLIEKNPSLCPDNLSHRQRNTLLETFLFSQCDKNTLQTNIEKLKEFADLAPWLLKDVDLRYGVVNAFVRHHNMTKPSSDLLETVVASTSLGEEFRLLLRTTDPLLFNYSPSGTPTSLDQIIEQCVLLAATQYHTLPSPTKRKI